MSDKLISKPFSSETYHNKQAKLISGSGLEDSASGACPQSPLIQEISQNYEL
jgi:hypothetical protein